MEWNVVRAYSAIKIITNTFFLFSILQRTEKISYVSYLNSPFFFFSCQAKNLASVSLMIIFSPTLYIRVLSHCLLMQSNQAEKRNISTKFQSSASESDQTFFFSFTSNFYILYLFVFLNLKKKRAKEKKN